MGFFWTRFLFNGSWCMGVPEFVFEVPRRWLPGRRFISRTSSGSFHRMPFLSMGSQGHDNYFSELAGLTTVTIFCFFVRFKHGIEERQSVDAVGDGLLAFVYVPILFGCFVYRLIFLPGAGGGGEVPGAWLLLFMIAAAKFTDMGAYITGSLIGKNKMAPHLSPAKTWEGFLGALGFAQLAAWGVWGYCPAISCPGSHPSM